MNLTEFLDILEKTALKKSYRWSKSSAIRAKPRNHVKRTKSYCPITAVCRYLRKGDFPTWMATDAAMAIGLDEMTARIIMQTADAPHENLCLTSYLISVI